MSDEHKLSEDDNKRLALIFEIQKDFIFIINEFFSQTLGIQFKHQTVFKDLMMKIMLNLMSSNALLTSVIPLDSRTKLSNNLIFRSIVDDLILLMYLFPFDIKEEEDRRSLKNELDNLDREYVVSRLKLFDETNVFMRKFFEVRGLELDEERLLKSKVDTKEKFKHLFKDFQNDILFTPDNLRETTDDKLKSKIPKNGNYRSFQSENEKFSIVSEYFPDMISMLGSTFKYFTQYHHYSPSSIDYIFEAINKKDTIYYYQTLNELHLAVRRLFYHFKLKDKTKITIQLDSTYEKLVKLNQLINEAVN